MAENEEPEEPTPDDKPKEKEFCGVVFQYNEETKAWSVMLSRGLPADSLMNQLFMLQVNLAMKQINLAQSQLGQQQAQKIVTAAPGTKIPRSPWG